MDGIPGQIARLLESPSGKTFGYGYGPGWSMVFGTWIGEDITVLPGQWVVRHDDATPTTQTPNHENGSTK